MLGLKVIPTPKAYVVVAKGIVEISKLKWKFLGVIAFLAFLPVVLERIVPKLGEIPGKILFVFVVLYFCSLVPYFVFRKNLEHYGSNNQKILAWVKAILCNIWVIFCIWFVYAGLFHKS